MSETHQDSGAGSDIDLSQFYQIFFEEAGENLDQMESMLLNLNLETADDEELNGIFRCAHSVKGGAATFGFTDVAELTHKMESLLDRLRRHELQPNSAMVDVLLESADASRSLLARHQSGDSSEAPPIGDLVKRIADLAAGNAPVAAPAPVKAAPPPPPPAPVAAAPAPTAGGMRQLEIKVGPLTHPEQADAISELFRDIPGLGTIKTLNSDRADFRLYSVETASTDDDLLDLFTFHVAREQITIKPVASAAAVAAPVAADSNSGFGFFDNAPGAPSAAAPAPAAPAPEPVAAGFGFFDGAPGAPGAAPEPSAPEAVVTESKAKAAPKAAGAPQLSPKRRRSGWRSARLIS